MWLLLIKTRAGSLGNGWQYRVGDARFIEMPLWPTDPNWRKLPPKHILWMQWTQIHTSRRDLEVHWSNYRVLQKVIPMF